MIPRFRHPRNSKIAGGIPWREAMAGRSSLLSGLALIQFGWFKVRSKWIEAAISII